MVLYFTYMQDYAGRGQYPLGLALCIASFFIAATFFGRVYGPHELACSRHASRAITGGVHSFIDVVGGFCLALLFFGIYTQFVHALKQFLTFYVTSVKNRPCS